MFMIRYDTTTGLINLMGEVLDEIPVKGMAYVNINEEPEFDSETQHLYFKNGQITIVTVEEEIE